MINHSSINSTQLRKLILTGKVTLGGNVRLKIYGTLQCSAGKRMNKQNRVFFSHESEAVNVGFRPCGHCLREKYLVWKAS